MSAARPALAALLIGLSLCAFLSGAVSPAAHGADAPAAAAPAAPAYEQSVTPTSKIGGKERPEPLRLTFRLTPESAKPGETVTLTVEMDLDQGWHGYSLTKATDKQVGRPTEIRLDRLHNLEAQGDFTESPKPQLYKGTDNVHHGKVTWTRKLRVTGPGGYGVTGAINYMICDSNSLCKPPKTIPFSLGPVPVGNASAALPPAVPDSVAAIAGRREFPAFGPAPLQPADISTPPAEPDSIPIASFTLVEGELPTNLAMNLLFAFLGGLLLNIMPCVLPVIAIKVLSFVQQAGESRGRILVLNMTYACGVVSVFVTLAALAVFLGKGWGSLFQYDEFNLVMAAIVFAMGLSLLGVFEIPVPGMVGSAAGGVHREGLLGAFATGIFATLLATPCSGPFMGTTLAWSVKQAPHIVFLVWGVMGLGMASPYLVIGAFPRLVHWLPKPGMWMVRFKEFAGFVLMGAVIWILTFLNRDLIVPALIIFVGIALGLWMIGNLYDHATPARRKLAVRLTAAVLTAGICWFGYRMQYTSDRLPWQEFSTARVEELRQQGTPILIDFTADWCNICKTNELTALNQPATIRFVEQHGIVPLVADYTREDPEIRRWLELCEQDGVPLTLIFPKGQPDRAIPLRGLYTQSQLLATLEQAVAAAADAAAPVETVNATPTSATGQPASLAIPAGSAVAK